MAIPPSLPQKSLSESYESVFGEIGVKLEKIDKTLTEYSFFPILGTLTGALESLKGVCEVIVAVTALIFSLLLTVSTGIFARDGEGYKIGKAMVADSYHLISMGVDDIFAGFVLAIPIIGSLASVWLLERSKYTYTRFKSQLNRPE